MQFLIGYSRVCITPTESVPLAGYGATSKRMSTCVTRDLYTTCIAFTDKENNTVLMVSNDLILSSADWTGEARKAMSEATGVPEAHILVSATHTHSAPDLGNTDEPTIVRYRSLLSDWMVDAAKLALADRKPATMELASAQTEGLNFVRHYYNTNPDGSVTYFGDNYGHEHKPDGTTQHMTQADPTLHVVKFSREGEKDVLLCNFRAHPAFHGASSKNIASSDYIGAFRETVQNALGCDFMYMQGACGNINHNTKGAGEQAVTDIGEFAMALTKAAQEALENMTPVSGTTIEYTTTVKTFDINHDLDSLYFEAKNIQAIWQLNRDINEVIPMCRAHGLSSPFHANAIVNRYGMGDTKDVQLSAYRIGDNLTVGVWPFEVFDTLAVYVEENAGYDKVITMGYAYPHISYLPTDATWEYTSYETDVTRFAPGTGEKISDFQVVMLRELKK